MELLVYPNFIPALGGAKSLRMNASSAWVTMADNTVIRLPRRVVNLIRDDGMAVAETARVYRYRNA